MRAFFIINNGNGTIRTETELSWNTPENKPNQLAKFDMDTDTLPTIPDFELLAWDGSQIVDADQTVYAAQAQLAQTRVLGLTDAYGVDVAILGRLLAGFGYALPCDPAEVLASIKGGLATGAVDWDLRTDADTLEQRYEALKRVMTDADIAAVGAILLGAQQ